MNFTSRAAGQWTSSGQTTWDQVGIPGQGDTATISTAVTLSLNMSIGTGSGYALMVLPGGSLSITAGVTLAILGDVQGQDLIALGSGAVLNFQNFTPSVASASNYYLQLVTSEYQISTNMLAWLKANLQPYQDGLACLYAFAVAFDLDTAVGPQLDILGSIIGESRIVSFQPSNGVSPVLDDTTYRLLLYAARFRNHWDGRLVSILGMWRTLFPGGTLMMQDNQDMSVSVYVAGAFTSILKDLILNGYILPTPQGVLYNYTFAGLPMLGFDRNDTIVAGFDQGLFT